MEQMKLKLKVEKRDNIFYVRCRPRVKQALYAQMQADGFSSMTDWFEQFIGKNFGDSWLKNPRPKK